MAVLIDTHKVYSKLIEAGFEKSKADVLVETLTVSHEDIVTKEYLDNRLESIKKDLLIQMWTIRVTALNSQLCDLRYRWPSCCFGECVDIPAIVRWRCWWIDVLCGS